MLYSGRYGVTPLGGILGVAEAYIITKPVTYKILSTSGPLVISCTYVIDTGEDKEPIEATIFLMSPINASIGSVSGVEATGGPAERIEATIKSRG